MRRAVLLAALALTACTTSGHAETTRLPSTAASAVPSTPRTSTAVAPSSRSASRATRPPSRSAGPPVGAAERVFAGMTERERVGQLLMVDCPTTGVTGATRAAITQDDVGAVILDGTSYAGVRETAAVTSQLRALAPRGAGLFIATDQEGGQVQRLQGPGFTRIVSAVQQGTLNPTDLQRYAAGWGGQLREAGVNVNLAPVLDVVPAGFGSNPPIGDLDREYGRTPAAVTGPALAVVRGMTAAGIDVTVKHFPGLGRTTGNTDTTGGVTDTVTTRHDAYLAPFRAAVAAGVPFVMMSTAVYARIDPGTPAAFSAPIVTGMLRDDLGFRGLVISDDVGAAAQVAQFSPGQRAVRFVAAGGDVVLTVDASEAGEMTSALLARARSDAAFKQKVDAAALRVLQEKQRRGLLG
jgi:beta-N-acetylhexosaminidase